jgi:hypothetical protein
MYHALSFLFVCQLPAISQDQIHLSIYRCQVVFTRDNWWLMDVCFLCTLHAVLNCALILMSLHANRGLLTHKLYFELIIRSFIDLMKVK